MVKATRYNPVITEAGQNDEPKKAAGPVTQNFSQTMWAEHAAIGTSAIQQLLADLNGAEIKAQDVFFATSNPLSALLKNPTPAIHQADSPSPCYRCYR